MKMYYNDIPVTDPGGLTFLNQFAPSSFQSLEIIKGPASSLYGAGTGGAILARSASLTAPGAMLQLNAGSFDYRDLHAAVTTGSGKSTSTLGFQHQQHKGYRDHSESQRDLFSWTGNFHPGENAVLTTSFLYGELFYETPGALTLPEYELNPRSARPAAGGFPGSATARASIRQRTVIAGASYEQQLSSKWKNKTVLYGMFTELRNPTIRNYEKSALPHYGGRSFFQWNETFGATTIDLNAGGEWQQGSPSVSVHKSNNGNPDSLRTTDEIRNGQQLVFAQAGVSYDNWLLTAGISYNRLQLEFERFNPASSGKQRRKLDAELAPRVALLKKFWFGRSEINVY
ncbi:MAG: TonB-dependent receptor, partial [Sphingobacteriales bacterium]